MCLHKLGCSVWDHSRHMRAKGGQSQGFSKQKILTLTNYMQAEQGRIMDKRPNVFLDRPLLLHLQWPEHPQLNLKKSMKQFAEENPRKSTPMSMHTNPSCKRNNHFSYIMGSEKNRPPPQCVLFGASLSNHCMLM